jgi:hypothetical protein
MRLCADHVADFSAGPENFDPIFWLASRAPLA